MSNIEKVIEKIRKLNALAQSSNVHEAAAATAAAARLMQDHQIEEAQLIGAGEAQEEPVQAGLCIDAHRRAPTWKAILATTITRSLGCELYTESGRFMVIGRKSDAQAVTYLYRAVIAQIDELCTTAARAQRIFGGDERNFRGWCGSFRHGAAQAVHQRLSAQKTERDREVQARADGGDRASSTALVVIDRREGEISRVASSLNLRTTKLRSNPCSVDGFRDGFAAGQQVNLGHNRGGLPAPARQIPR